MGHLDLEESKETRGIEVFPGFLEMWFRKKASEEKREKPDLRDLAVLTDLLGLLVFPVP